MSLVRVGGWARNDGQRDQKQPFLVTCRLPSHSFVSIKTCFISFLAREYPCKLNHPPPHKFSDYQFGTNVYILVLLYDYYYGIKCILLSTVVKELSSVELNHGRIPATQPRPLIQSSVTFDRQSINNYRLSNQPNNNEIIRKAGCYDSCDFSRER